MHIQSSEGALRCPQVFLALLHLAAQEVEQHRGRRSNSTQAGGSMDGFWLLQGQYFILLLCEIILILLVGEQRNVTEMLDFLKLINFLS